MNYNKSEAAELSNISYPSPVHFSAGRSERNFQKNRLFRRKLKPSVEAPPSTLPRPPPKIKERKSPSRQRFSSAFSRAIAARVRFLSRALTEVEWKRLRDAVRQQCSPRKTDSLSTRLEALTARLTQLENASPQGALMLQDSISMFATQVSVLREQFLQHTLDKEHVQENCSHFQYKKRFTPREPAALASDLKIEGIGHVIWRPKSNEIQLCCEKCLEARKDALFYWTGFYLKAFNQFSFHEDTLARSPEKVREKLLPSSISPLMVQDIWSQIISHKFKTVV